MHIFSKGIYDIWELERFLPIIKILRNGHQQVPSVWCREKTTPGWFLGLDWIILLRGWIRGVNWSLIYSGATTDGCSEYTLHWHSWHHGGTEANRLHPILAAVESIQNFTPCRLQVFILSPTKGSPWSWVNARVSFKGQKTAQYAAHSWGATEEQESSYESNEQRQDLTIQPTTSDKALLWNVQFTKDGPEDRAWNLLKLKPTL